MKIEELYQLILTFVVERKDSLPEVNLTGLESHELMACYRPSGFPAANAK